MPGKWVDAPSDEKTHHNSREAMLGTTHARKNRNPLGSTKRCPGNLHVPREKSTNFHAASDTCYHSFDIEK